jgi:hypothetical protein
MQERCGPYKLESKFNATAPSMKNSEQSNSELLLCLLHPYLHQNGIDDSETYLLEFRTTEPPSTKRIPELLAFCRATERDSSYVVPPTMNMTTSWGLLKDKVHVIQTILPKILCNFLLSYLNIIIITSTIKDHLKYKLMSG